MFSAKTKVLVAVSLVAVLMALTLGVANLCLAQGLGGLGGQEQPAINPPSLMKWEGPDFIGKSTVPFILVFDNEDAKATDAMSKKIKFMDDQHSKVCLIKVILTTDDLAVLFPKKTASGAPPEATRDLARAPAISRRRAASRR